MFRLQSPLLAVLAALMVAGAPRAVGKDAFVLDPESVKPRNIEETRAWKEGRVPLPPWPSDSDLVEFEPDGPVAPFRFYIDTRNLSVDTQGKVVRYTLVAESKSGIRNVSFEGIRCTLRGAYKAYAYGTGGRFSEAMETDWLPITTEGSEGYREDLWRHRFCVPREARPRGVPEIVRSLDARGLSGDHRGFQSD